MAAFDDRDGDGRRGAAERFLAGVTVRLLHRPSGAFVSWTTDGQNDPDYCWNGLSDGDYVLTVVLAPLGYVVTPPASTRATRRLAKLQRKQRARLACRAASALTRCGVRTKSRCATLAQRSRASSRLPHGVRLEPDNAAACYAASRRRGTWHGAHFGGGRDRCCLDRDDWRGIYAEQLASYRARFMPTTLDNDDSMRMKQQDCGLR